MTNCCFNTHINIQVAKLIQVQRISNYSKNEFRMTIRKRSANYVALNKVLFTLVIKSQPSRTLAFDEAV